MKAPILLAALLALPAGGLLSCSSLTTADVADTRPEVRYYVIADT